MLLLLLLLGLSLICVIKGQQVCNEADCIDCSYAFMINANSTYTMLVGGSIDCPDSNRTYVELTQVQFFEITPSVFTLEVFKSNASRARLGPNYLESDGQVSCYSKPNSTSYINNMLIGGNVGAGDNNLYIAIKITCHNPVGSCVLGTGARYSCTPLCTNNCSLVNSTCGSCSTGALCLEKQMCFRPNETSYTPPVPPPPDNPVKIDDDHKLKDGKGGGSGLNQNDTIASVVVSVCLLILVLCIVVYHNHRVKNGQLKTLYDTSIVPDNNNNRMFELSNSSSGSFGSNNNNNNDFT